MLRERGWAGRPAERVAQTWLTDSGLCEETVDGLAGFGQRGGGGLPLVTGAGGGDLEYRGVQQTVLLAQRGHRLVDLVRGGNRPDLVQLVAVLANVLLTGFGQGHRA